MAVKGQPDVLTGLRAPQTVRLEEAAAREFKAAQEPTVRAVPDLGFTVYESEFARLRVQITSPQTVRDLEGRETRKPPLVAQFEQGRFINRHPDEKTRAYIDRTLQAHPRFGLDRMFWLANDAAKRDRKRSAERAMNLLKSLPKELVQQVVVELQESGELDLKLPERGKSAAQEAADIVAP